MSDLGAEVDSSWEACTVAGRRLRAAAMERRGETMRLLVLCVALLLARGTEAGCLGAGTGWGSCPAAPFRCQKPSSLVQTSLYQ